MRKVDAADVFAILFLLSVIALAAFITWQTVEQYRSEKAAIAAFNERQFKTPIVPKDDPAEIEIYAAASGVFILAAAVLSTWRHRVRRRQAVPANRVIAIRRHSPAPVAAKASRVEKSSRYQSRRVAADRLAIVVRGDRAARQETEPSRV